MRRRIEIVVAVIAVLATTASSLAQPDGALLQYFEAQWNVMRHRMPDVFMSGYGGVWLPPPNKAGAGSADIGYDPFDRFDLGSVNAPTRYGTEAGLRLLIREYHRAHVQVFVDWIMNHNATSDNNTPGFIGQGGYPGLVLDIPGVDPFGDFHVFSGGCPQSTSPGGGCFNLFTGRLIGLIDIDQTKNHQFIRQPTTAGDPNNIPAGTLYNRPDPANARFYADTALAAQTVVNPGTSRNPGALSFSIHPFNAADPMAGDPVSETALGLLVRSTQWMLEDVGVDGFRLDAAKHTPTDFWDKYWDAWVWMRHTGFDGTADIPYSFVEVVEGGGASAQDWVRKPGVPGSGTGWPSQGWQFGNRDALDINEGGALRDLVSANGFGSWSNVVGSSFDNRDDGLNNGTIGVHHVNSHDNAVADTEDDTVAFAYVLARNGAAVIYHNALQFGPSGFNFPRNKSRTDALGLGDAYLTRLVQIRNEYARGQFVQINNTDPVNQSIADVLVFTRRTAAVDNLLVAVNDRENAGVETRNVATAFPAGTRLQELTGNAADPVVDPNGDVPDVLVVDAQGRLADANNPANLFLKIPNNRNVNGVFHGRGYVMYGPAAPSGTLTLTNIDSISPPDGASVPEAERRLTAVPVIRANTFEIQLQTTQTDPLDPNTDDRALFRIDSGFTDANNFGGIDHPTGFEAGFEEFLTQNAPLFLGGTGTYRQVIDATQLSEGMHYVTVWAFRHRTAGDPIIREFRAPVLIDRLPPQIGLLSPTQTGSGDILASFFEARVSVDDPDVASVHLFLDEYAGTDLVALAQAGQGLAQQLDPNTYSVLFNGAIRGNHRIDVVVLDQLGVGTVASFTGINATTPFFGGLGDIDNNFAINGADIAPFVDLITGANLQFHPAADLNGDGLNDAGDLSLFVDALILQP
ncbi:MAG: hypothetical protein ACE5F9_04140 [Phycisphaerae bacterium]